MAATFPPSLGGNGQTYDNESFALGGHRTNFVPALEQVIKMAESAVDSATDASASKTAAKASETAAKTSETAAANFANAAQQTTLGFDTNRPTIKPSLNLDFVNQQVVDRRIVVNRNSPKTYFGKEKVLGDENLLRYSEDFSNAVWSNAGVNLTVNTQVAPDGTLTADTVTEQTNSATHRTSQTVSLGRYIASVYVKSVDLQYFVIAKTNINNLGFVAFDIQNGSVAVSEGITGVFGIEPAANGFYRIWLEDEFSTVYFHLKDAPTFPQAYLGTGKSVILWGAQLETAREGQTKPTAYVRTDAYPVRTFFNKLQTAAANTMPVEFDPITQECLGIKPESQATNIFPNSENPSINQLTIETNAAIAPSGRFANKYIANSVSSEHFVVSNAQVALAGVTYVASCKVKFAGSDKISFHFGGQQLATFTKTDIENNTGNAVGRNKNLGGGWYLVWVIGTPTVNNTLRIFPNGNGTFVGDGYTGSFITDIQLEASTLGVPSSYIPTTTAAVTRLADDVSIPVSAFEYNQNEGTLYAEVNTPVAVDSGLDEAIVDLSDGSGNERVVLFKGQAGSISNAISFSVVSAAITGADFDLNNQFQINTNTRFAVSFARNNVVVYNDGQLEATDSSVEMPTSITKMQIGNFFTVQRGFNGYIRALRYYPKALSALEAQALSQI